MDDLKNMSHHIVQVILPPAKGEGRGIGVGVRVRVRVCVCGGGGGVSQKGIALAYLHLSYGEIIHFSFPNS